MSKILRFSSGSKLKRTPSLLKTFLTLLHTLLITRLSLIKKERLKQNINNFYVYYFKFL
jgi:hypothetical protein